MYNQKDVEDERLENEQEQQKKYGTKVVYGDFIQVTNQHISDISLNCFVVLATTFCFKQVYDS